MLFPSKQHQRQPIIIAEAEAENTPTGEDPERVRMFPQLATPFGFQNEEWEALKSQVQPGDELWEFCTNLESWENLMGLAGIELMRQGEVIASIITRMN